MPSAPPPFRLGPWLVDPAANEIRRDGAEPSAVRLEPKAMAVLVALAARPGEAVSRAALEAAAWPDVVVTEASLTRCVSQLRQALADDPHAPRVIETVTTVGYRLLVAPTPLAAAVPVRTGRSRLPLVAGAVVLAGTLAVAWRLWSADPLVVAYRIETSGDVRSLVVTTTRADGREATERIDAFPATREVRGAVRGQRYRVRATGTAGAAEVRLGATIRRGDDMLAQSWAVGTVDGGAPQPLDVRTHVIAGE